MKRCWIVGLLFGCAGVLHAQMPEIRPLDPLPVIDSLDASGMADLVHQLSTRGIEIQQAYEQEAQNAASARLTLEEQLAGAKTDSTVEAGFLKDLEKAVKSAKKQEKSAQKQAEKVQKAVDFALSLQEMDSLNQRKNVSKAYKNLAALIPETVEEPPIATVIGTVAVGEPTNPADAPPPLLTMPPADTAIIQLPAEDVPPPMPDVKNKKEKKAAPSGPVFKSYDPKEDVMLNPPARNCAFTVDLRDEFSGERRRELPAEELFRFTNPVLRPYLQDRDHIICQASLSTTGGNYLFNLNFTINDVNARRTFGSLPRNGVLVLKLLDGETFTLYNLRNDEGQAGPDNQSFTYRGQYSIDPGMFKKLQRAYLDKARVAWSTGYEDYDVQNIDLVMRQLGCLLKN